MTTFLLQHCSQGTEMLKDLHVHVCICKNLQILVAKIKSSALLVTFQLQPRSSLESYLKKDFKAQKTPGIVFFFFKVMRFLEVWTGAYSGVLKTSRQMPPCMGGHPTRSGWLSLTLSGLQRVLILTGASERKSSLVLTLNNAARSLETPPVAELQKLHTSVPTSGLLISVLNLAHLTRPVELRGVYLQHLDIVMLRTF